MREKEDYRDNLEEITRFFGPKRLLTIQDVADYTGRSREFVSKNFDIPKLGITTASLARRLSQ